MEANEWFELPDDSEKLASSQFINRYIWRDREGGELIVSFDDDNGNSIYKYYDFPEEKFTELQARRNNPESYRKNFSKWFLRSVTEEHEHKSVEEFKSQAEKE